MFLVAQTYEPGSKEFNEVMDIAVATYPEDETANLNAACAALNDKNWTKAANYLKKAGNTPEGYPCTRCARNETPATTTQRRSISQRHKMPVSHQQRPT